MKLYNKEQFTSLHRGLHWSIAGGMIVLFITGFLRMEWMGKKAVIGAMKTKDLAATEDQMREIYKAIREPMWQWHEYAAYLIFLAFAVRIIYMLSKGMKFPNPFNHQSEFKERFQGYIYLIFYLFVLESCITGIYLKWFEGDLKEPMEAVHKWGLYVFPAFILLHLIGIYIGERTSKKGIVSKMIGGN